MKFNRVIVSLFLVFIILNNEAICSIRNKKKKRNVKRKILKNSKNNLKNIENADYYSNTTEEKLNALFDGFLTGLWIDKLFKLKDLNKDAIIAKFVKFFAKLEKNYEKVKGKLIELKDILDTCEDIVNIDPTTNLVLDLEDKILQIEKDLIRNKGKVCENLVVLIDFAGDRVEELCSEFYKIQLKLEYFSKSLKDLLLQKERFSESELFYIAEAILNALQNIGHGDICPENILLDENGVIKLLDYRFVNPGKNAYNEFLTFDNIKKNRDCYISPFLLEALEINVKNPLQNIKNDIFSLGLVILECGLKHSIQDIFNLEIKEFERNHLDSHIQEFSRFYSEKLLKFINKLINFEFWEIESPQNLLIFLNSLKENGEISVEKKLETGTKYVEITKNYEESGQKLIENGNFEHHHEHVKKAGYHKENLTLDNNYEKKVEDALKRSQNNLNNLESTNNNEMFSSPNNNTVRNENKNMDFKFTIENKPIENQYNPIETQYNLIPKPIETQINYDTKPIETTQYTNQYKFEQKPIETQYKFEQKPIEAQYKFEQKPIETQYKFEQKPIETNYKFEQIPIETQYKFEPKPIETTNYKFEQKPIETQYKFEQKPIETQYKFEQKPIETQYKFEQKPIETQYKFEPKPIETNYNFTSNLTQNPIETTNYNLTQKPLETTNYNLTQKPIETTNYNYTQKIETTNYNLTQNPMDFQYKSDYKPLENYSAKTDFNPEIYTKNLEFKYESNYKSPDFNLPKTNENFERNPNLNAFSTKTEIYPNNFSYNLKNSENKGEGYSNYTNLGGNYSNLPIGSNYTETNQKFAMNFDTNVGVSYEKKS